MYWKLHISNAHIFPSRAFLEKPLKHVGEYPTATNLVSYCIAGNFRGGLIFALFATKYLIANLRPAKILSLVCTSLCWLPATANSSLRKYVNKVQIR